MKWSNNRYTTAPRYVYGFDIAQSFRSAFLHIILFLSLPNVVFFFWKDIFALTSCLFLTEPAIPIFIFLQVKRNLKSSIERFVNELPYESPHELGLKKPGNWGMTFNPVFFPEIKLNWKKLRENTYPSSLDLSNFALFLFTLFFKLCI